MSAYTEALAQLNHAPAWNRMRPNRQRQAIVLAILLGACLIGLAVTLNVGWIVLNWRELLPLVVGIPVTLLLIAGVVLNTTFLVREVRRNERQDSFLNAVTHELKTPIASIRLYLETLQRRPLAEEKRQEFYRIMLSDSDRLLRTVEQVLKAGEVAQRTRQRSVEPLDLGTLVTDVAARVVERNHLPQESLTLLLPATPLQVSGNADDLQTALGNLLGNAVKYSPDGVAVVVRVYAAESRQACVEVTDQGIGIPSGELKRIFRRFYRVPARAVSRRKGTGLGLFLVRSIAKQHGGSVKAFSRGEGTGSTFTLRLPQNTEALAATPVHADEPPAAVKAGR